MSFEVFENANITWNRTFLRDLADLMDDGVGAAGPLDGTLPRLYTDTTTFDQDTDYGDITKATLLGSSTVALTYVGPVNLGTTQVAKKTQIEAVAGSSPTAETITGVLIVNAAADDWVCLYKLPSPVGIALEGDGLSVDLQIPLPFKPNVA